MNAFRNLRRRLILTEPSHQHFEVEALEDRILLSTVQVIAAGAEGGEQMQLQVDGNTVQVWDVTSGADSGNFGTYTWDTSASVEAEQVRIAFTNDLYDQVNDIDRNLRVDAIIIDGQRFETEDPAVFSTGTWQPEDGITPGNRESEFLHSNGYFQFANDNTNGFLIQVRARGDEGSERFRLRIEGTAVATFDVTTDLQTYSYSHATSVTADQVSVELFDSEYDPANDFDENLTVDYVRLDGVTFQTEAPSTFSTGTWRPEDGIQPGNRQSEVLHDDGIFQYASSVSNDFEVQIRARGNEGVEQFRLLVDGDAVANYTTSTSFQTFRYAAPGSVTADQIRIEFLNDEYDSAAGIDNNLIVDRISIAGTTYETESPTTFSTGTWSSADGVQPGFRTSETLHVEGYFQFVAEAGTISLGITQLTINEDAGNADITIRRTGSTAGAATAYYQTLGVEATDGSDFNGTANGHVAFADGQANATVSIQLIDDGQLEPTETFSISLFRTEGAELGVPRTAIISILDDETGGDLAGHWKLDESSTGQSVVDSSGNGNNGAHTNIGAPNGPTGDTPNVDSLNPRGLSFDGANDYVSIGNDPSLDLSAGTFTQSVWIKPEITDNAYHGVLGYQTASSVNRYPGIWVTQQNRIHAGFGDGTNWNSFTTGAALTTGDWNHVATTFDGTTYRAFVNGVSVYSTTAMAGKTPVGTSRVDIGRVDNYFDGNIDDVRIYNRALSPLEVSLLLDGADVPPIPNDGEFVANSLVSGFDTPIEVEWLPDGRMLVAEQDGYVRVVNTDGTLQSTPLLDITSIVNAGTKDRGMIGFTVHPDFENNPYIYASYTYDPPEVNGRTGLGGPDGNGARVARISRFTVNAAGTFANINSNVVLIGGNSTYANIGNPNIRPGLNDDHSCVDANGNPIDDCIAADETSHTIGELEFGPDGMLYAASGDGGSFGRVDPINLRALDIDSFSGKILRIDPITGQGPSDNPFYNGNPDANQSKVFVYGLRNPFRFALNDDANNPGIFIGDVGWTQWEEVNFGTGGENFGWPAFEGGNGTSLRTGGYQNLAQVQSYYASNPDVTAPLWARLHSAGGRAIVMGDFAGTAYPAQYVGALLFTDIGDQVLRAATFDAAGDLQDVSVVSAPVGFIVDMHTGPDGLLYYVDITGSIGRIEFQA